jgi:hypothetical protein
MRTDSYKAEAEECRRQAATAFAGKPEGAFLLRLAGMFEELAADGDQSDRHTSPGITDCSHVRGSLGSAPFLIHGS